MANFIFNHLHCTSHIILLFFKALHHIHFLCIISDFLSASIYALWIIYCIGINGEQNHRLGKNFPLLIVLLLYRRPFWILEQNFVYVGIIKTSCSFTKFKMPVNELENSSYIVVTSLVHLLDFFNQWMNICVPILAPRFIINFCCL